MGKTARADVVEQTKLVAKYQAIVDKKPDEPDWGPLKAARVRSVDSLISVYSFFLTVFWFRRPN